MPQDCCHPIAAHQKLRIPDTYVSSLMLDRALDAHRAPRRLDRPRARHSLSRRLQPRRQTHLHRPPSAADVPLSRPRRRGRPLSAAARGGREGADRPSRSPLPARPPDRDARRGGGGARRRRLVARLRPLHADLRQGDGRRTADQAARRSRSQALSRRARLRPDAPHGRRGGRSEPPGARRQAAAPPRARRRSPRPSRRRRPQSAAAK